MSLSHVRFISAGAGSGKTYRLTQELERLLSTGKVEPAGVIGTTFTVKAASELRDRVRIQLLQNGHLLLAERMDQALIGTVHSVCERLLIRFAFELGLSPKLDVATIEDGARLFNQALDEVLSIDQIHEMNSRATRLGLVDDRNGTSWQDHVKSITDQARSNDIDPSALNAMGAKSADRFLSFFPAATDNEAANEVLKAAVQKAIENIDLNADTTKVTARYVSDLRSAAAELESDDCRWPLWVSLRKKSPSVRNAAAAIPVQAAASRYDRHEEFHADIRGYIEGIFRIAGDALARFQAIKTERGLIDYNDMEQLALRALDEPSVVERLEDELELLLVDEFQDTNPMQLGLFMKLARFARKVIFVGDVKQAIYGFRGSDPELLNLTIEALVARGCEWDSLQNSWRSRPPVMHYLNAVFTAAFEKDNIDPSQVELEPEREDIQSVPAVICWTLPQRNAAERADALAAAIADLFASGHTVSDPETWETRAVRYGDIAVLATTNDHVEAIAKALRNRRVPMKMTLSGLLEVPEICLARACLRRLNDPADTLATAEIRSLGACEEPETWLADRLRWLAAGENDRRWSETDPIVAQIERLREQTITQSPIEIVARVLNYVGIRSIVTAWGPDAIRVAQRQRNLDAFLDLAVQYEDHCTTQHEAATLTGFLFWLESPSSPELDRQPVVTGGDAVHVLTYHRAKGLEWPVVVATDFHYTWRPRLWDVRTESETDAIDLDNPLGGRSIVFYPNVFGRNTKDVPVLDDIMASEETAAVLAASDAEGRRLAYVGMTRARDTIIIAVPSKKPRTEAWIWGFESDYLLPTGDELAIPTRGPIPSAAFDLASEGLSSPPVAPYSPTWFLSRTPAVSSLRERLIPSDAEPVEDAAAGEIIEVGPRISVHGKDMTRIGAALHAVIAAELVNPGCGDAIECATVLIESMADAGAIDPADAVGCARRLSAVLANRFGSRRMLVEYPVELLQQNGQVIRGWIDLLLETSDGWLIVDHKSSPRPRADWATEAIEHSGQLEAYKRALHESGLDCAGCWVHFPVGGGLVEVKLP